MSEQDKANKDLIQYGQSFMVGGKHIPLDEVILSNSEQSKQIEAQKREDMLMDMYKLHAYIPNDAEGNPLTPFGNFCAGYEAATAEANKRIEALESEVAELKAELKSEKEHSNILLKNGGEFYRNELALKAHINDLREKLETALTSLRKYENGI